MISYMEEYAISVKELTLEKCNVIRLRRRQKQQNHVQGNDIQDAKQYSIRINPYV